MATIRRLSPDRQAELCAALVESYTASETQQMVDVFLRALVGPPRRSKAA